MTRRGLPTEGMFLLTSIPHSGTQFFQKLFVPERTYHATGNSIHQFASGASLIACAIRRPEDIALSWWHRGKLMNKGKPGINPHWERGWRSLARLFDQFPIWPLPIDHPRRDEFVMALADRLDRQVAPDWSLIIGARKVTSLLPIPNIDLSIPYSIPIFRSLYESRAKEAA